MTNLNVKENKTLIGNFYYKKRYIYFKKIKNYTSQLKYLLETKQQYKKSNSLIPNKKKFVINDLINFTKSNKKWENNFLKTNYKLKRSFSILYTIHFHFSVSNTLLHITDAFGNSKFFCSAGLMNFKGKQKKIRILVLKRLFFVLRKFKISFIKNKPIALHFQNVGNYKKFIIKNLKKYFYIKIIKNYSFHSYNGCRKKKKVRKRIRSRRK